MPKKNKKKIKETTIEDFYDLRSENIDELVAALKGEIPEDAEPVSYKIADCVTAEGAEYGQVGEYKKYRDKEFNPYKIDRLGRIPAWVIAMVIKWWFSGVICWFIVWGLADRFNNENLILFSGLCMGLVVDFLVNPAMRYFETDKKEYNAFMMFPFKFKAYWTLLTNILYYILVILGVSYVYEFVILYMFPNIGMEPVFYGIFCVVVDMVFIGIKDLIVYLVKRNKNKKVKLEEAANV